MLMTKLKFKDNINLLSSFLVKVLPENVNSYVRPLFRKNSK